MEVRWTVDAGADGVTEVRVEGDVDMAVEDQLHDALSECIAARSALGGVVTIDLSDVGFMDSAGLRSLMRLHVEHGDAIAISRVSGPVARLFEVAGVADWLLPANHGRAAGALDG